MKAKTVKKVKKANKSTQASKGPNGIAKLKQQIKDYSRERFMDGLAQFDYEQRKSARILKQSLETLKELKRREANKEVLFDVCMAANVDFIISMSENKINNM